MKTRTLLALFLGFLAGVLLSLLFNITLASGALIFLIGTALFCYGKVVRSRAVFFVSLLLLTCAIGSVRTSALHVSERDPSLDAHVGSAVVVEGVISDEPDVRVGHTNLTIDPKSVTLSDGTHAISHPQNSRILVSVDPYPAWQYGDRVKIAGKLILPEDFESDTGRVFPYVSYLSKDGIFYQMEKPQISLVDSSGGNAFKRALFSIKHALLASASRVIPEPESSLAGGITLGAKQSLGNDTLSEFRIAGIIHIVVLSGYNITIVADSIMRVLGMFPRVLALSAGSFGVILFAVMTGAGATVVRSSIMSLLVVFARATGRSHDAGRLLLLAAWAMILWNPYILLFDPSFQLSFIATLGLIYIAPILERAFSRVPDKFSLRGIAAATTSAQIAVLPLLLYQSGIFSTVALPVNMLVLPSIPFAMLMSFLSGVLGLISAMVALPFGFLAYLVLKYTFIVAGFFSSLPFAAFTIPAFPLWAMFIFYAVIFILIARFYMSRRSVLVPSTSSTTSSLFT